jgi:hypothetical protein
MRHGKTPEEYACWLNEQRLAEQARGVIREIETLRTTGLSLPPNVPCPPSFLNEFTDAVLTPMEIDFHVLAQKAGKECDPTWPPAQERARKR